MTDEYQVFILIFLASVGLAVGLGLFIIPLARRLGIVDQPNKERKIHTKPTPLMGGLAIFLAFFIVLYFIRNLILSGDLEISHWLGFFLGGAVLMIGGILDDKYNLSPLKQLMFPILAAILVVAGGVEIQKISNPLGGFLNMGALEIPLFTWNGVVRSFVIISDTIIILWLMGMMYTTKLLDGVDGLVSGMVAIGAFIIFLFTMTIQYFQPDIGVASLALAGAAIGFLILNWHPAKIFLGDGGSLFLGYALGVLAIISGGKIAIALLIMGIPIMDVVWTIGRRLRAGKNPFKFADRQHLHFRVLDLGLTQRQTVLIYYGLAAVFGLSALFLQSLGKLIAVAAMAGLMLIIVISFAYIEKQNGKEN